jgi:hypothetical protein
MAYSILARFFCKSRLSTLRPEVVSQSLLFLRQDKLRLTWETRIGAFNRTCLNRSINSARGWRRSPIRER